MKESEAKEILSDEIQSDGSLYSLGWYLCWNAGDDKAVLDGDFTADDLEAIAFWMRKYKDK